jgi:putative DNA primase/helicase
MTIELRTGIDRPPRPEDYCTKLAGSWVAPEGTPCPMWMQFLKTVTGNDDDLIGFLKRFLGYCMTGYVRSSRRRGSTPRRQPARRSSK